MPESITDKYNLYAIWVEGGFGSRPVDTMIIFHVSRPMSFKTMCQSYILQHLELTIENTGQKIETSNICGIQKVPNSNIPLYQLRQDGTLINITA